MRCEAFYAIANQWPCHLYVLRGMFNVQHGLRAWELEHEPSDGLNQGDVVVKHNRLTLLLVVEIQTLTQLTCELKQLNEFRDEVCRLVCTCSMKDRLMSAFVTSSQRCPAENYGKKYTIQLVPNDLH